MRHLDEGILQAWLDGPRGGLPDEERAAVAEHLASCADCAVRLETLRETTDQAVALLGPLEASDEELPDFEAIVARARDLGTRARPWRRWVAPAWAASVAVALGVGWLTNEMSRVGVEPSPSVGEVADAAGGEVESAPEAVRQEDPPAEVAAAERERDLVAAAPIPRAAETAEERRRDVVAEREPLTIRGQVTDAETGKPLETAQISIPQLGAGGLTDTTGRFEIALGALPDSAVDGLELRVDLIGYASESRPLGAAGRRTVSSDFQLEETALRLQELVVTGVAGSTPNVRLPFTVDSIEFDALPAPTPSVWRSVSPEEAESTAGFAPRTIPGLGVLDVGVGTIDGVEVVRVVQALDDGTRVLLFQASRAFEDPQPNTEGVASAELDGVFVVGRAPLPSDSIRSLLARLR